LQQLRPTIKKSPHRLGATAAGRRGAASGVKAGTAAAESGPAHFYRRHVGQDEDDSSAGPGAERRAPAGKRPPRTLEEDDIPRGSTHQGADSAAGHRWGPIDGELFLGWVTSHLVSTLKPRDIVVMDNLSAHKVAGVREAITAAGARLA